MSNFENEQERKQLDVKLEKLANIINKANEKLGVDCKCKLLPEDREPGICIMDPPKQDFISTRAISSVFDKILKEEDSCAGLHSEKVAISSPYAGWYPVSNASFLDLTIDNFEKNYEPLLKNAIQDQQINIASRKNDGR